MGAFASSVTVISSYAQPASFVTVNLNVKVDPEPPLNLPPV